MVEKNVKKLNWGNIGYVLEYVLLIQNDIIFSPIKEIVVPAESTEN